MGTITVTEFVSMDGVMQAPGGEKFKYEGWTFEFDRGEDGGKFKFEELFDAEAQLIGRVTYESFAGAWPEREGMEGEIGEFAKRMNEMPKYLVSSTIKDPEWNNTTVIDGSGDVPKEVAKLKEEIDGDILVSGSRRLVHESARARPRGRDPADGLPGGAGNRRPGLRRVLRQVDLEARRGEPGRVRRRADARLRKGLTRRSQVREGYDFGACRIWSHAEKKAFSNSFPIGIPTTAKIRVQATIDASSALDWNMRSPKLIPSRFTQSLVVPAFSPIVWSPHSSPTCPK